MRILFSSMRMTGHLRPLFPYARKLLELGHDVRLASPDGARSIVEAEGIAFLPFDHPGDKALQSIWARARDLPPAWATSLVVSDIFAGLNARAALPALREAVRDWKPDLVVRESAEFASAIAAAEAGVPIAQVAPNNDVMEAWMIDTVKARVDLLRLSIGLDADDGSALRAAPLYTSFPRSLTEAMPVARERDTFRVRTERRVLSAGEPPSGWGQDGTVPLVFVSLGTLATASGKGPEVYRAAVEAAADVPAHFLVSTGGVAVEPGFFETIPDNVTVETWVKPGEVYPRAAAVLCHGGSGTVLEGLSAGVPMVLTPLDGDQFDNAERVAQAGAGSVLLDSTAVSIAAALTRALEDQVMRRRAREISDEMSGLPDVQAAVEDMLAAV